MGGYVGNAPFQLQQELDSRYAPITRSGRNLLINGNFLIWQRGTSQTANGYGSDDRWANQNTGTTKTHSLQTFALGQTDVPFEPVYFSRTVVASVAGAANFCVKRQFVEDVRRMAGRRLTLSFSAKADAAKSMAIELYQFFGTGGSPSAEVLIAPQKVALTTAWQRFALTFDVPSIAGKVLGSDGNHCLAVGFWFDAGSSFDARTASLGQQSGTFDLAQVQLEFGDRATDFEWRSYGEEVELCQRYLEFGEYRFGSAAVDGSGQSQSYVYYKTRKRAAGAISRTDTGLTNSGPTQVANNTVNGFQLAANATTINLTQIVIGNWSCSAEL